MAVEAVLQLQEEQTGVKVDTGQLGVTMHDVNITKPLILLENNANQLGIEVITTVMPVIVNNTRISEDWSEFFISSYFDGTSTQHCNGKIRTDTDTGQYFSRTPLLRAELTRLINSILGGRAEFLKLIIWFSSHNKPEEMVPEIRFKRIRVRPIFRNALRHQRKDY